MIGEPVIDRSLLSAIEDSVSSPVSMDNEDLFDVHTPAQGSFLGTFLILINTAIGTGTLEIPTCYPAGYLLAIVLTAAFGVLTFLSVHFLVLASKYSHHYDYSGLFDFCFTKRYRWVLNLMIVLQQMGNLAIYFLFIGRLLHNLIGVHIPNLIFSSSQFWTMACCCLIVFPLGFPRSIAALDYASTFALVFLVVLVVHSITWWIYDFGDPKVSPVYPFDFSEWKFVINAFSIDCLAFNIHLNLFPCLEQLKNCTVGRARMLGLMTISVLFLLYVGLGLFTYLDKRDLLESGETVLEYYDETHIFTEVTTCGVVIILLVSCPVQLWALRNAINTVLFDTPPTNLRWVVIGGGCCLFAACLSSISDDIMIFFDFIGGVVSPVLIFLLPALFYLKCHVRAPLRMKYLAFQHIGFTVLGAVASLYAAISSLV
jgi:amino acid permease